MGRSRSRSRSRSPRRSSSHKSHKHRSHKSHKESRRSRSRSKSPEKKERSKKRRSNWDQPAAGMSAVPAAVVPVAGLATMPTMPTAMAPMVGMGMGLGGMGMMGLAGMGGMTGMAGNPLLAQLLAAQSGMNGGAQQQQGRKQRELYVGNLPIGMVNNTTLKEFFDTAMEAAFGPDPTGIKPCVRADLNSAQTFAFVEFRTPELGTQAIQLNGLSMHGRELRVARPSGYVPPAGGAAPAPGGAAPINPMLLGAQLSATSGLTIAANSKSRKLYIGNLPLEMDVSESSISEFFNTAMTAAFGNTEGLPGSPVESVWMSSEKKFCFVTFRTDAEATKGLQLDGIQMMGRSLRIGRPSDYVPPAGGAPESQGAGTGANAGFGVVVPAAAAAPVTPPTAVLRLANAVTAEEVDDDDEYEEILEDMREECNKHGTVQDIKMPREGSGKTLVFVHFDSAVAAGKALTVLHGRSFDKRIVQATYYDETKFAAATYE